MSGWGAQTHKLDARELDFRHWSTVEAAAAAARTASRAGHWRRANRKDHEQEFLVVKSAAISGLLFPIPGACFYITISFTLL